MLSTRAPVKIFIFRFLNAWATAREASLSSSGSTRSSASITVTFVP